MSNYYQVPRKPLGDFNITNDQVYIQSLSSVNSEVFDTNFGNLAKLSAVPTATTLSVGGIRLYSTDTGIDDCVIGGADEQANKNYAVRLIDNDNIAYVHVPWINTTYVADQENTFKDDNDTELDSDGNNVAKVKTCLTVDVSDGNNQEFEDGIATSGGIFKIGIQGVPSELLRNIGDMVRSSDEYSSFNNVSVTISEPLQQNIDDLKSYFNKTMQLHYIDNNDDFNNTWLSIDGISNTVSSDYYLKINTSSDVELSNKFNALSDFFIAYLHDTLDENVKTNPAYLTNETSSESEIAEAFDNLSTTITSDYYNKTDVYNKSETSSDIELFNKFNTKQDNLIVNNKIEEIDNNSDKYTDDDIATVDAIVEFVKASVAEAAATFQGQFDSWSLVPEKASGYLVPPPNKNDYIYVVMQKGNELNLSEGTWKFIMAQDEWDTNKKRSNWSAEYKISDTLFTDAQTAALNSGITKQLRLNYSDARATLNKLSSDYNVLKASLRALAFKDNIANNITGRGSSGQVAIFNKNNSITGVNFKPNIETWIFETYNGKIVKKNVLAQNI